MKKIRKIIKDEAGITLVELLAAISLLSVVIILAGAIHMFGQRQFVNQTDSAHRSNDLSYALTVISTDIRKRARNDITFTDNEITIKEIVEDGEDVTIKYFIDDNYLYRNTVVITDSVYKMEVKEGGTYSIIVTLYSNGTNIPNKEYETRITPRGGYRSE